MKRIFTTLVLFATAMGLWSQAVVTDPTSMAQRIALFLEEMEETVSQSMDLADNSENTLKLLRISKETAESLVKVSNYIKTSRQIVEIAEAEIRIAEKLKDYSAKIKEMESATLTEKLNMINSMVNLGSEAMKRIKSAMDMVKNGSSDAKLSDYERLQILTQVESEVLAIENAIDSSYEKCLTSESIEDIKSTLENLCFSAMMFFP
ncbi:MAG: hypothetical protein IJP50_05805 [Paludibacteraceae bacterium]|jgi:hypothetical protein|nr:hypothetical protein [Paludibacteraceae bacterium]MDY6372891.1 hypothetical protein [Bacteroidales bacterium]